MATVGVVLRQNDAEFQWVQSYYDAAGYEPTKKGDLKLDRTDTFGNTFADLVHQIAEYRRSSVVIVCHGNPKHGILAKVAKGSNISAGIAIPLIEYPVHQLKTAKGDLSAVGEKRLGELTRDLQVKRPVLEKLLLDCYRIRSAKDIAVAVHVRGCNIGQNLENLKGIRQLFNSARVTAPVSFMVFTKIVPTHYSPADYGKRHRQIGKRKILEAPGLHPLLLDIRYENHEAKCNASIEVLSDMAGWAKVFYKTGAPSVTRNLPIACLYPDGDSTYRLPYQSEDYAELLAEWTSESI